MVDISLPNLQERKEIYELYLRKIKISESSDDSKEYQNRLNYLSTRMASLSPGFSGAEISQVCNESAIIAVRSNHSYVTDFDFEMGSERVLGGLKKLLKSNPEL